MANRQLEELERAQVETTRALQLLSGELRRSRDPRDVTATELLPASVPSTQAGSGGVGVAGAPALKEGEFTSKPTAGDGPGVSFLLPSDVATRDALGQTTRAVETLSQSLSRNTQAVESNARSLAEGIRDVFAGLVGIQSQGGGGFGFLSGGFGLASLGLKIAGLFGGREDDPVSFTPYELPRRLDIEAVNTDRILAGFPRVVRGQSGEFRPHPVPQIPTQVVINVNALDTQSFLDRSGDVAQAVRDAMLHMHPLNDIVSEV